MYALLVHYYKIDAFTMHYSCINNALFIHYYKINAFLMHYLCMMHQYGHPTS
jgi:hypothetical protein